MVAKYVKMVEFWRNWTKSIEIWQYCHYTRNHGPWVLSGKVGDKGVTDGGWICINSRVLTKLEEILRKRAILPLHSESGALGVQRAGGRLNWHRRCRITAKSVLTVKFGRDLKQPINIWQYCHCTGNRGAWVLSEQVGGKELKRSLEGSDDG